MDDTPLVSFLKRIHRFVETLPIDACNDHNEKNTHLQEIGVLQDGRSARLQFEEVLRLMSDILSHAELTPESVFEELQRCAGPLDVENTWLSKVVKLQAAVDALASKKMSVVCLEWGVL